MNATTNRTHRNHRFRKRHGALMGLFMLAALTPAFAASTYYVAPNGNDAASGSAAQPWLTLQHAADLVQAGDTVIVRAGVYAGFELGWNGPQNGTAGNPITFRSETPAAAQITSKNNRTPDAINLEGASYIVLDGFEITNPGGSITRAGIRSVTNHHVTVRNCRIDHMGRWGIFTGFSDDLLIENNRSSNAQIEHGVYVSNSCVRPVLRDNVIFDNRGNGLHMNGDESQGGVGIITDALIERNIIYNNGTGGGSAINCDGVQRSIIRNNLLYNNHASGISLYRIDASEPAINNVIVNNTILMAADGRWCVNIRDASTGNVLFNNILYHAGPRGSITISSDSRTGFVSDYNIVKDLFSPDDANLITLAAWRTQTGQDTHSRIGAPADLFVNAGGNDYHLKAGCVAENGGVASLSGKDAPPNDLEKNSRPSGNGYDAGAYERQVAPVKHSLEIEKTGTGSGGVDARPAPGPYDSGTVVTLTAVADQGSVFGGWSGDANGLTNPLSLTMDADKRVTATFNVLPVDDLPPEIDSGPTAAPNPARVGELVAVQISAHDPEGGAISIAWNLGDGATGTGARVEHVWSAAGIFTLEATVTDPTGQTVKAQVGLTVLSVAHGAGDLNGDGVVNIDDLQLVTTHFGQTEGDPNWNLLADSNNDGVVNVNDLMEVTSNFGKTY